MPPSDGNGHVGSLGSSRCPLVRPHDLRCSRVCHTPRASPKLSRNSNKSSFNHLHVRNTSDTRDYADRAAEPPHYPADSACVHVGPANSETRRSDDKGGGCPGHQSYKTQEARPLPHVKKIPFQNVRRMFPNRQNLACTCYENVGLRISRVWTSTE